jgi:hypothetical protein
MKPLDERDYIIFGLFILVILMFIILWHLDESISTLADLYTANCQITTATVYYNISNGVFL